jgi:hypothetical protein
MVTLEYPNGYFCTYKAVHCTEGYRYGCEKCLKSGMSVKPEAAKDWTRDMWETRTTVTSRLSSKLAGIFAAKPA